MANFDGNLNTAINSGSSGGVGEQGSLEVALCGYGAQFPRANDGTLARVMQQIMADPSGTYQFSTYGNDVIEPPGTYYTIAIKNSNGDIVQVNAYVVEQGGSYDLKDLVPFDPNQPPPPLPQPLSNLLLVVPAEYAPHFDGSQYTTWLITLDQDVPGATIGGIVPGNLYTFIIEQDAVGNHLFIFPYGPPPYGTQNVTAVCLEPNSRTVQTFVADEDGMLWAIGPGTWETE